MSEKRLRPARGLRPFHGVFQNLRDILAVEGRIALVAGTEIENLSEAALIAAAAAKRLAAREPANENQLVGRGNIEAFAIGFLVLQLDVFRQIPRDGVSRLDDPNALLPQSAATCIRKLNIPPTMPTWGGESYAYSNIFATFLRKHCEKYIFGLR
jgi:hypothetical protein